MTSVDERLAALKASGGFGSTRAQSEIDALWEIDSMTRRSASAPRLVLTQSSDSAASPSPEVQQSEMRNLKAKVRALKSQLADEQMRNATAAEELSSLRSQLTHSQEALVAFAQRAREDREEVQREGMRKRSVPGGLGGK